MKTIIRNGQVCLEDLVEQMDILIEGEKIAAIGKMNVKADREIDAEGLYVLPGMIDFHVHLDDQIDEFYIADTYETGSRIAIQNGITTICSFITQPEGATLTQAIEAAQAKAKGNCHCDYIWHLTPTTWDEKSWQEIYYWLEHGFKTIKLYTTYKDAGIYSSYEHIETVLKRVKPYGVRTLIHCEDETVLSAERGDYDVTDPISWAKMRSKKAEITAISNITELANRLEAPVHIVHVSTVEGAQIIEEAKAKGFISCETGPQYWALNDESLREENGHRYLCTPPLRDKNNQTELKRLTQEGVFDIYATDHCPFTKSDKDKYREDVTKVPKGLPGLGALIHMVPSGARHFTRELSANPAKLAGLYPRKGCIAVGSDADLVLLDFEGPERSIRSTLSDAYDPYARFTTRIKIIKVLLRGAWYQPEKSDEMLAK